MPGVITEEVPRLTLAAMDVKSPTVDVKSSPMDIKVPEPSMLVGPPLDVPVNLAIDMLRISFEKYHDKFAIASMFQPADYLQPIFDQDTQSLCNGSSRGYLRWTYGQLKHAGELLAVALAARGVREGSTIAVLHHGSVDFYVIFYAALVLRCRFAPMNYHSITNADEIQSMLKSIDAKVVCATDDKSMHLLFQNVPELSNEQTIKIVVESPKKPGQANGLTGACEYLEEMILDASEHKSKALLDHFEALAPAPDADVLVIFTSGTSSLPKACPLTNKNLTAIATNYGRGLASGPTAVTCNHLPIYHIAGAITGGWNPLANGGAVIHPAPSFTAKSTVDAIRQEGVTFMVLVPSMIGLLINDPALPPADEMFIENISLGASTILYTDVEKCYEYLGAKRVITSYAMTEGLMMTRANLPREPTKATIMGIQRIAAGTRLKICAPNSNTPVPRGEAGEVHQNGASTIKGYIGKVSDNFYTDEYGVWCKTGDQAIMHDDGGIQITGRYKDLVIRGGVNISPQAIEGVIARILRLEAHVVGMPDSIAGEVPVAVVRDADIGKATPQKLRSQIIKELGPRFALEKFISLSELGLVDFPRTSTGKIRKVDLQSAVRKYAQEHATDEPTMTGGVGSNGQPTIDRLIEIWSDVAGVDVKGLTAQTSVQEVADSLMMARYASTVRQKFGRPFTLADLTKAQTLGEQAALLDSRGEEESATVDLYHDREGPPTGPEMFHVGEDEVAKDATQRLCEKTLIPMGFSWDDVEDVVTPSQWLQSWVKTRETSDRFRAAYISTGADVATFTDALTETLRRNDSLRAVSLKVGDGSDLQVILRHTSKWLSKVITIHKEPVKTLKDLENLIPGDFKLNHGLAQVVIAEVEETHSAGCCLMTLHSTFDAFSLNIMRNDLNYLLNKKKPKQHVPYKLWADHLYNTKNSAMAESSIKYNVKRLRGLATKRAALWPPQRAPVWQRGCDKGLHVTPDGLMTSPDDPEQRKLLDGKPEDCKGSDGIRKETQPRDLTVLASKHSLSGPILVKAALVLLETRLTGQSDALFTQTFSMRDNWPFIDEWMSRRLPSPLEITGPTLARIAEIIPIEKSQNVMDWMLHLKSEQDVLIKHCHAPYRFLFDALSQPEQHATNGVNGVNGVNGITSPTTNGEVESGKLTKPRSTSISTSGRTKSKSISTPTQVNRSRSTTSSKLTTMSSSSEEFFLPAASDGAVMESIRKRINFQWLPIFSNDKKIKSQVRLSSSSHFNEVGLAVKAGLLVDQKTIWVKMEWDDGNIRSSEIKAWIAEMVKYVEVLGREENWKRSIKEIYEIAGFAA